MLTGTLIDSNSISSFSLVEPSFSSVQMILLFIHILRKDTYWNNITYHGYNSTKDNLIINEWYNSKITAHWHSLTICVTNPMPNPLHVIN